MKWRDIVMLASAMTVALAGCSGHGGGHGGQSVAVDEAGLKAEYSALAGHVGADKVGRVVVHSSAMTVTVAKGDQWSRLYRTDGKFTVYDSDGPEVTNALGKASESEVPWAQFAQDLAKAKEECDGGKFLGELTRTMSGVWLSRIGCDGSGRNLTKASVDGVEVPAVPTLFSKEQFAKDLELMLKFVPDGVGVQGLSLSKEMAEGLVLDTDKTAAGCAIRVTRAKDSADKESPLSRYSCESPGPAKSIDLKKLGAAKVAAAAEASVNKMGGWAAVTAISLVESARTGEIEISARNQSGTSASTPLK